jgi:hypothetical protein
MDESRVALTADVREEGRKRGGEAATESPFLESALRIARRSEAREADSPFSAHLSESPSSSGPSPHRFVV